MRKDTIIFLKRVILISLPVMLQQLLNNMLNMTDTIMIGTLGETALSGVAVANKIFFIYQLILFGLTNGVGIFISQYCGSNQQEKVRNIFNHGVKLSIVASIIAIFICILFKDQIIALYITNPETIAITFLYLGVILISFIPFALTNMYSVAFRIMGFPKFPMIAGLVSFIINITLNSILIFGLFYFPALGVLGAAIATVVSRFIETFMLMILANKYLKSIKLSLKIELSKETKKSILHKTIPLMCNELIWSIGLNIIFINYSYVNEAMIPSITLVDTISNLIYVAFSGCSVAISVIIGQSLGGNIPIGEIKRDVSRMLKLALTIYILGGFILILTRNYTPMLFSLETANTIMASKLLIVKALFAWTQGYSNTIYYVLRAGGDTKSVLIIDGLFTWFCPVLLSFIVSRFLSLDLFTTYLIVEGSGLIKVVLATYFLRKEKWIKNLTYELN